MAFSDLAAKKLVFLKAISIDQYNRDYYKQVDGNSGAPSRSCEVLPSFSSHLLQEALPMLLICKSKADNRALSVPLFLHRCWSCICNLQLLGCHMSGFWPQVSVFLWQHKPFQRMEASFRTLNTKVRLAGFLFHGQLTGAKFTVLVCITGIPASRDNCVLAACQGLK